MKKKLTKRQFNMLWGDGPYSQAKLIKEVRILDNKVSRVFITVEVEINPTTFELVKKYRNSNEFKEDFAIQQLLEYSEYRGPEFGYVSMAFNAQFTDSVVLAEAELVLERCQKTIIKMHNFVINNFL